ncbi:Vacuolar fusion protein mon1, partial [Elasticomyces elasticus]
MPLKTEAKPSDKSHAGSQSISPQHVPSGQDSNAAVKNDSPTKLSKNVDELQRERSPLSRETTPPPLPPRPTRTDLVKHPSPMIGSLRIPKGASRPQLQARATTAISSVDFQGDNASFYSSPGGRVASRRQSPNHLSRITSHRGSDGDDSGSIRSYAPTLTAGGDVESLLGEVLADQATPAWKALSAQVERDNPFEHLLPEDEDFGIQFYHEFDELESYRSDGSNEEHLLDQWKSKLKHFLILSSAGKPVWSRHGDDQLISNYVGIVQTLISFYQGANDALKGFTAGDARFVIMSKGHLNLVAISRLGESDGQLHAQLESLYMQILSTLTLPNMERMFSSRPSTDLRRPLQGTEKLLDALADGFTRGSPSTLLSAIECLKLRKSQRQLVDNTLLKVKSPSLLYGLIVAGGKLVSVVRPKKHSLHPGDLHLIFNMLFEAEGVKAGGGENWIPLCLPGFNNTGFLYMYVNFLSASTSSEAVTERPASSSGRDNEIATIFISANKEGFFELQQMRAKLVDELEKNGSMAIIKTAVQRGRPSCHDIMRGTVLRHFLYKSRGNVQFVMPSFEPHFRDLIARR